MARTRKLTKKYWNTLGEGSRKHALLHVFPGLPAVVSMLLREKPRKESPWWSMVFDKVRIPEDNGFYMTVVNQTFIP